MDQGQIRGRNQLEFRRAFKLWGDHCSDRQNPSYSGIIKSHTLTTQHSQVPSDSEEIQNFYKKNKRRISFSSKSWRENAQRSSRLLFRLGEEQIFSTKFLQTSVSEQAFRVFKPSCLNTAPLDRSSRWKLAGFKSSEPETLEFFTIPCESTQVPCESVSALSFNETSLFPFFKHPFILFLAVSGSG